MKMKCLFSLLHQRLATRKYTCPEVVRSLPNTMVLPILECQKGKRIAIPRAGVFYANYYSIITADKEIPMKASPYSTYTVG